MAKQVLGSRKAVLYQSQNGDLAVEKRCFTGRKTVI